MSSLFLDYPRLLAGAARAYGGASAADWLSLLGRGLDSASRRALKPLCADLAERSGRGDPSSLFSGFAHSACGVVALQRAHKAAFGSGLPVETLLAGAEDDSTLPQRLAERVVRVNEGIWRSRLSDALKAAMPFLSDDERRKWLAVQTPAEWFPPPGARGAAIDLIDAAALDACHALVARTCDALNRAVLPGQSIESKAARCLDEAYVRRFFRMTIARGIERMCLGARLVREGGEECISLKSYRRWHRRQVDQQAWLERTIVRDTTGQVKDRPLAQVTPSNHAKRSRLLAILAGIDLLAQEAGLSAALVTQTLPPEWHPSPSKGKYCFGGANFDPGAGASKLIGTWSNCLRDLDNVKVKICGIRVVEAHEDGCPHLHSLVYYRPQDEPVLLERLARAYEIPSIKIHNCVTSPTGHKTTRRGVRYDETLEHFRASDGRIMPGEGYCHRIDFSRINRTISTAVSYVGKYVTKSLAYDTLPAASDAPSAALAHAAHASLWGYRRFAVFGVRGSLSGWTELRRLKTPPKNPTAAAAWAFAQDGDFAGFLRLVGGLATSGYSEYHLRLRHTLCKSDYGDMVRVTVGVELRHDSGTGIVSVWHCDTRTPGRFMLIPVEQAEEGIIEVELPADF